MNSLEDVATKGFYPCIVAATSNIPLKARGDTACCYRTFYLQPQEMRLGGGDKNILANLPSAIAKTLDAILEKRSNPKALLPDIAAATNAMACAGRIDLAISFSRQLVHLAAQIGDSTHERAEAMRILIGFLAKSVHSDRKEAIRLARQHIAEMCASSCNDTLELAARQLLAYCFFQFACLEDHLDTKTEHYKNAILQQRACVESTCLQQGKPRAKSLHFLSIYLFSAGYMDDALEICEQAVTEASRCPETATFCSDLALYHSVYGNMLFLSQAHASKAVVQIKTSIEEFSKSGDLYSAYLARHNLSVMLHWLGQTQEAIEHGQECFFGLTYKFDRDMVDFSTFSAAENLAQFYTAVDENDARALPLLYLSFERKSALFGVFHPGTLATFQKLVDVLVLQHRLPEVTGRAEQLYLQQKEELAGRASRCCSMQEIRQTIRGLRIFASLLALAHRFEEAASHFEEWLSHGKKIDFGRQYEEKREITFADTVYNDIVQRIESSGLFAFPVTLSTTPELEGEQTNDEDGSESQIIFNTVLELENKHIWASYLAASGKFKQATEIQKQCVMGFHSVKSSLKQDDQSILQQAEYQLVVFMGMTGRMEECSDEYKKMWNDIVCEYGERVFDSDLWWWRKTADRKSSL